MIQILSSKDPVEDLQGEVLVLFHFEDMPAPRGFLGRVDWLLRGRVSRLISQGRFNGTTGSALLLTGNRRVKAEKVLVIGLGKRPWLNKQPLKEGCIRAIEALGSLKSGNIIIAPPYETLDSLPWEATEDFFQDFLWALSEQTPAPELSLTILERDGASLSESPPKCRHGGRPLPIQE